MGATVIVSGLLEGLQLVTSLSQAASAASKAVQDAQTTGQPVDFTGILGSISTHETAVLAAIAQAKAAGK
jgi:hypothetical protein